MKTKKLAKKVNKRMAKYDLNAIERVGLAAAVGSAEELAEIKRGLMPGVYSGEMLLRVVFMMDKAESTMAAPTANLLSRAVIARALVNMGAQRVHFLNALRKAAEQAFLGNGKVSDNVTAKDARVLAQLDALYEEVIDKLPKQPRSGATKVVAVVCKVQEETPAVGQDAANAGQLAA